ncbi:hypothetical protein JMN32_24070 [Fulvivirga sp. 29W222]|uniref:Urease accessory protein UreF n=1 Tax=Fulvivirga marina TaxID=2494733 RepID=A0A937G081_9BACT|nr:urease accessory UreF family protein [Fulvivirga marina]MBL6449410.1 hypothetical protein [Fulvivirga marina]
MNKYARLMHLVDSSLPTGSFANSSGLESSITFGMIKDVFQFKNYLYSFLQQSASMDIPFINSCFNHQNLDDNLLQVTESYNATMLVPSIHKASVIQGKNWLRLMASFYPGDDTLEISTWFSKHAIPIHFVILFPLCMKRAGFSLPDIHTMYLHIVLRDQVSAAIRLGFIGAMEGNKLQHDFYTLFDDVLEKYLTKGYTEASRSAFLLDTAQVFHEFIYSKLFQN